MSPSDPQKAPNYKLIATLAFAFTFAIFLSIFAYQAGPQSNIYPLTYIVCLSGCVLGWLFGIITTPYDKEDKDKTTRLSKLVGTFISGYFLSKFDKLISNKLLDPSSLTEIVVIRFLLFLSFFALAWIMTYVFRLYFTAIKEVDENKAKKEEEAKKLKAAETKP